MRRLTLPWRPEVGLDTNRVESRLGMLEFDVTR